MKIPEQEMICFKNLNLVTPDYARALGIRAVDRPVFVSYTDSTDSRPFTYDVGTIVQVPYLGLRPKSFITKHNSKEIMSSLIRSRPKYGIGYHEFPIGVMTKLCSVMKYASWVALIKSVGTVLEFKDDYFNFNRVTDELTVKEILAFCCGCYDGPLNRGFIVDIGGEGGLLPVCDSIAHDKHFAEDPNLLSPRMFFEIGRNHEVLIRQT